VHIETALCAHSAGHAGRAIAQSLLGSNAVLCYLSSARMVHWRVSSAKSFKLVCVPVMLIVYFSLVNAYQWCDAKQGVRFVRGTHLLFTASKDKTLKYWDADRFEKVL
jgi:hypothetical protein